MARIFPQALTFEAHAKVNLCLAVGFPPRNGYHPVRSVFQELDVHDLVRVRVVEGAPDACLMTQAGTRVALACAVDGLAPEDNLIFRALDAAERACGRAAVPAGLVLAIDVDKRIPAGGGLGGGSSDAAAMLKCYAHLTGLDESDARLEEAARSIGADVAFFMHGGAALLGGRGDAFEASVPPLQAPIVLMGSPSGLSTAAVYSAFDEDPQPMPDANALARAMRDDPHDLGRIAALCANNLGPIACALDRRIQERLEAARSHAGVLAALVSGSGSTSFAICAGEDAAQQLASDIAPLCSWVRVCRVPPILA